MKGLGKTVVVASGGMMFLILSAFLMKSFMSLQGGVISLLVELEYSTKYFFYLSIPFFMDPGGAMMSSVVLFISSCVMVFSGFYMAHEVFMKRFISIVSLFVLSMNLLIFCPNFLMLMVGWDGLGVVSFLLVIYYMNKESLSAGMITAISNRVGDVFFILSIAILLCKSGFEFFSLLFMVESVLSCLVVLGSMTKSAQIPFSAWLPAAMAAPTPVSALVHSSTLVTAGVYAVFRFSFLVSFEMSFFLMVFSMMTLVMAGVSAVVEMDMKKVIALSTLSQLGVMMLSVSFGMKMLALFHLVVHAFFKALMFLCVGAVIFYSGGVQDSRFSGGLWHKLPLVSMWFIICNLSLMGLPFMSGFYSKDLIVECGMVGNFSSLGLFLFLLSIALTVLYSVRLLLVVLMSSSDSSLQGYYSLNIFLVLSTVALGFGAIWGGYAMQKLLSESNSFIFACSDFKMVVLLSVVLGGVGSVMLYFVRNISVSKKLGSFFLSKMWFLPLVSGNLVASSFLVGAANMNFFLEKGWLGSVVWGSGLKGVVWVLKEMVHGTNAKLLGVLVFLGIFVWVWLIF
uniref:NADH dehydrogenase subunit 5 n=1 Tax=Polymesoda caroliniana TaxID=98308 RepID=UPI002A82ECB5|nr:NADH dehydrogenase subunit 5 [Polymesoda caroliniana]WOV69026.1 NADH dehydrogenase subunit 5 [Polymesoda caroliniana]